MNKQHAREYKNQSTVLTSKIGLNISKERREKNVPADEIKRDDRREEFSPAAGVILLQKNGQSVKLLLK